MTSILSRDEVRLRQVGDLDEAASIELSDTLLVAQDGALKRTTAGAIFDTANAAALDAVNTLESEIITALGGYVNVNSNQNIGGTKTFTGNVIVPSPTNNFNPTTKQYVDTTFVGLSGTQSITGVKTFSSSPVIPTVATTTNNTQAASTAFVQSNVKSPVFGVYPRTDYDAFLTSFTGFTPTLVTPTVYAGSGFGTNGFTVPAGQGGLYFFELYVVLVGVSTPFQVALASIERNTTLVRRDQISLTTESITAWTSTLNCYLVLNAGDFIKPVVLVGTSGTAKLTDLEFLVTKLNNY